MKQGKIQAVIVGADRIAANGDTANKIGTYSLAVLAEPSESRSTSPPRPPRSTCNWPVATDPHRAARSASEVTLASADAIAPDALRVYNPAFDVTPAENITAIITEKGVLKKPDLESVAALLRMPETEETSDTKEVVPDTAEP